MEFVGELFGIDVMIGFLASAAITAVALSRGSLSRSGGAAAVVIGTAIYAGGGPSWFGVLFVFFVTSTGLGKVGAKRKADAKREFDKSDTRDAWQVLANGGAAAACAIAFGATGFQGWAGAFVGAMAAANADTWATELGVLSRRKPWLPWPLGRVPRGTSGAVSPAGLAASAGGALAIGVAAAVSPAAYNTSSGLLLAAALLGGMAGSLSDSLLGASLQAGFHCPRCHRRSESPVHFCGTDAPHVRGLRWLNNDGVNLAATALGAFSGGALVLL